MKAAEASAIIGGLSKTSKMPGPSFGTSALDCQTGSKLREVKGSVCASCYARKGQYAWPNVRAAHARRLATVFKALEDDAARAQWVAAMVRLLDGVAHFRWHDSGDLQSRAHYDLIAEVCRATPDTRHWLPTKEAAYIPKGGRGCDVPGNLVIRLSAPMMDGAPVKGYAHTSTAHTATHTPIGEVCGASTRGGACGPCRACWDSSVANVSYPKH